ncbi:MAG TPA: class I SAM-dependent methyltransferase, partial [Blastocatellia bacterium]|nr:class I SAM-dependent methyltransferase [Blastocatellia bacterium]
MNFTELTSAIAGVNLCALKMALKNPKRARGYLSHCLRKYDEMTGQGLPKRDPLDTIFQSGWGSFSADDRVELPTRLNDGGGTSLNELLTLACVTRVLQPKKIFEIGTFNGRTTVAFILNAPIDAEVITLDLPVQNKKAELDTQHCLMTDQELIETRKLGFYIRELQLEDRCQQILCNSLEFDPTPHLGTVELGFIDGAHTQPYVQNDTIKMAMMVADRGLVFWHDY